MDLQWMVKEIRCIWAVDYIYNIVGKHVPNGQQAQLVVVMEH